MPTAKITKTNKKQAAATKESGEVYISSTGNYYKSPDISADQIRDYEKNVYLSGLILTQINLLFCDKYTITVLDKSGTQDEKVALDITKMCDAPDVRLWPKIQIAWVEEFKYGTALFNDVWNYDQTGVYQLQKLRHLHSKSFDTAPLDNKKIYSQLLQGITLNAAGEIQYYQTNSGKPKKIDNVCMIKNPTSTELAGESTVLPIIPIISMLKFGWDTQMQQANRTGAKILFLKVTEPQAASEQNGNFSDVEFAENILMNWGKNTSFVLRENMEIIDPHIKDDSNVLEIIAALNQMLIDYVSPINLLTAADDSAKLGGSDSQRMDLILRYIRTVHNWLEEAFEQLLQKYLDVNGYDGYTVNIHIPKPEINTSEIDIRRAEVGAANKALTQNEIRTLLGEDELDEEGLTELENYYKRIQPTASPFSLMSSAAAPDPKFQNADKEIVKDTTEELLSVGKKLSERLIAALDNEL